MPMRLGSVSVENSGSPDSSGQAEIPVLQILWQDGSSADECGGAVCELPKAPEIPPEDAVSDGDEAWDCFE